MTDENREASNWRRFALPVSLVLNLFLIAMIGGHVWRVHRAGADAGTPMARALANIEANLDQRDTAAFRAVMRRDEPRISASWQQLIGARRELARELVAEPFDKRAAKQALIEWRTAGSRFLDDFSDTLADALA
jgi:uncharacterized membrane protein